MRERERERERERDLHTSKIKTGYGSLPWKKKNKKEISVVLIKFFFKFSLT